MDTINSKQKNSLIVLVILILVVLGVFYFKSNKVTESPSPSVETKTEEQVKTDPGAVPVGEEMSTTPTTVDTSLSDKEEEKKFSTVMINGSNAFLAKNYDQAIKYYKQALGYKDSDVVYIRLFSVYNAQNNIDQARLALEKAIKINPSYTDYWVTKFIFLDEKTNFSFIELKKVYTEGLGKVDSKTKINLVTTFARIAENNGEKEEAIKVWEYAKTLYPQNSVIYQGEIDRLSS